MKQKKLFPIIFLIMVIAINFSLFAFSFLLPPSAVAAEIVDVACQKFNYPWCTNGSAPVKINELVNNIYVMALGLAGAAAFGVIIFGAIQYTVSAGNATFKEEGKKWIQGGLMGLGLLLGAYLLLYTINPELVKLRDIPIEKVRIETPTLSAPAGSPERDEAVRRILGNPDNQVSSLPSCPPGTFTNCVDFSRMHKATVDEITSLNEDVNRWATQNYGPGSVQNTNAVFITGGDECAAHATTGEFNHCNGYKFDARNNSLLINFIKAKFDKDGTRNDVDGEILQIYKNSKTGAEYVIEPAKTIVGKARPQHIDVLVKGAQRQGSW